MPSLNLKKTYHWADLRFLIFSSIQVRRWWHTDWTSKQSLGTKQNTIKFDLHNSISAFSELSPPRPQCTSSIAHLHEDHLRPVSGEGTRAQSPISKMGHSWPQPPPLQGDAADKAPGYGWAVSSERLSRIGWAVSVEPYLLERSRNRWTPSTPT